MCYYFSINIKPIKTCNIDEIYFNPHGSRAVEGWNQDGEGIHGHLGEREERKN